MSPPNGGRRAALFDMDRTLVAVNSAGLYVRWRMGRNEATWRDGLRASRYLMQYKFGLIDADQIAAENARALSGSPEWRMREDCQTWYNEVVRSHVTDLARREVARCQEEGLEVAILSAQTNYATEPLARDLGIDHVVCSRLEVDETGHFTGDFTRPLCYGSGKVELAQRWAEQHDVNLGLSRFYSDSISDLPMLEAVGDPRIVNPDPRLKFLARNRRWPTEHWR